MQALLLTETSNNVRDWKKKQKLPHLGVPLMRQGGSVTVNGQLLEAIFLPRLGPSLQGEMQAGLSEVAVLNTWVDTLDALQYLHSRGFSHNDIKPSNICYGRSTDGGGVAEEQVTLIDYGTASRFAEKPAQPGITAPDMAHHLPYEAQPPMPAGPIGTLKYASSDAHAFVTSISRRGDLESLGYMVLNMLGTLPWDAERDWRTVGKAKAATFPTSGGGGMSKAAAVKNAKVLVKKCNLSVSMTAVCVDYMAAVFQLEYDQEPEYTKIKTMLTTAKALASNDIGRGGQSCASGGGKAAANHTLKAKAKVGGAKSAKKKKAAPTGYRSIDGVKYDKAALAIADLHASDIDLAEAQQIYESVEDGRGGKVEVTAIERETLKFIVAGGKRGSVYTLTDEATDYLKARFALDGAVPEKSAAAKSKKRAKASAAATAAAATPPRRRGKRAAAAPAAAAVDDDESDDDSAKVDQEQNLLSPREGRLRRRHDRMLAKVKKAKKGPT